MADRSTEATDRPHAKEQALSSRSCRRWVRRNRLKVAAATLILAALLFFARGPEILGFLAGHLSLFGDRIVCHYQTLWPPGELHAEMLRIYREDYGIDYRSGLSCVDGSRRNRYYSAFDRVTRQAVRKRLGAGVSRLSHTVADKAARRTAGVGIDAYMNRSAGKGGDRSQTPLRNETPRKYAEAVTSELGSMEGCKVRYSSVCFLKDDRFWVLPDAIGNVLKTAPRTARGGKGFLLSVDQDPDADWPHASYVLFVPLEGLEAGGRAYGDYYPKEVARPTWLFLEMSPFAVQVQGAGGEDVPIAWRDL